MGHVQVHPPLRKIRNKPDYKPSGKQGTRPRTQKGKTEKRNPNEPEPTVD